MNQTNSNNNNCYNNPQSTLPTIHQAGVSDDDWHDGDVDVDVNESNASEDESSHSVLSTMQQRAHERRRRCHWRQESCESSSSSIESTPVTTTTAAAPEEEETTKRNNFHKTLRAAIRERHRTGRIGRLANRRGGPCRSLLSEPSIPPGASKDVLLGDLSAAAATATNGSTPRQSGNKLAALDGRSKDDHDDQITETTEPLSSPLTTLSSTASASSAQHRPDYIPPRSTPGAFYQLGRAFGDLPEWFRRSSLRRRLEVRQQPDVTALQTIGSDETTLSPSTPPHCIDLLRPSQGQNAPTTNRQSAPNNYSLSSSDPPPASSPARVANSYQGGRSGRLGFSARSLGTSIRGLFFHPHSSSSLPVAEILDAEKVVYAQVQESEGNFYLWGLIFYTVFVLMIGIFIGRLTAPHFDNGISSNAICSYYPPEYAMSNSNNNNMDSLDL